MCAHTSRDTISVNYHVMKKSLQDNFKLGFNLNYTPLYRLGMDLKVMPRSNKGHKYILCIIDEVTNYLITIPIY